MAMHYLNTTITGGQVHLGDINHTYYHANHGSQGTAEVKTILAWLSNLNFGATLTLHCNKRAPSTGTWLLEDYRYVSWRACNDHHGNFLWCRGNPGSVIEHLRNTTKFGEAVAYCFFDYARRQELTADAVLAEFLVQLASKNTTRVFPIVRSLYEQAENGRRRPTLKELTVAFANAASAFEKFSVVVDALDECDHSIRRQFLLALNTTSKSNMHTIVFSRPHVQPGTYLDKASTLASELEIKPLTSDLLSFIGTRIAYNEDLECIIGNSEITLEQITERVIEKAGFSFLATEMRLNAIQFAITAEDLTRALQSGLTDPTDLYAETLNRINAQHHGKARLALMVLSWLSLVKRPLTIRELCHALGIQLSNEEFSRNSIPAPETVLSSCFGLVIQDRHNDQVRLLHYTLLEFLEQHNLLKFDHQQVLETCLKCLSTHEIEKLSSKERTTPSRVAAIQMQILRSYPFSEYAAVYWFAHVFPESEFLDPLLVYLANSDKLIAWLRLFDFHDPKKYRRTFQDSLFGHDPSSDSFIGIRLAVAMGLNKVPPLLIAKHQTNQPEMDTMLAAILGNNASDFLEKLLTHGLDPCYQNADGSSLLRQTVALNFSAGIIILAIHGADPDQHNSRQETPLQVSLVLKMENCSRALIQCGAHTDVSNSEGNTILHTAVMSGASESLVRTLLSRGSQTNVRNSMGQMPIHLAMASHRERSSQEALVKAFLEHGSAVADVAVDGYTVLHHATIWSWSFTTIHAILVQFAIDLRRNKENLGLAESAPPSVQASFAPAECATLSALSVSPPPELDTCTSQEELSSSLNFQQSLYKVIFRSVSRCQFSLDQVDLYEKTPLHYAVLTHRVYLARSLLQAGFNANHRDCTGQTALHLALNDMPDEEMISLLLDHKANALATDVNHRSALELAIMSPACAGILPRLFSSLPSEGARMSSGSSLLIGVISHQHSVEVVEKLLLQYPAEINSKCADGDTPLHLAIKLRMRRVVELLLHNGAKLSNIDRKGNSALHAVISNWAYLGTGYIEILLEYGADVDELNSDSSTAFQLAIRHEVPVDQVKKIISRTRNINGRIERGNSALHIALNLLLSAMSLCTWDYVCNIVQVLLESGADVDIQNDLGYTPLHTLAMIMLNLTKRWDLPTIESHDTNLEGHKITLLAKLLHILLGYNPDLRIHDHAGQTALDRLDRHGHSNNEVIEYFASRLARPYIRFPWFMRG